MMKRLFDVLAALCGLLLLLPLLLTIAAVIKLSSPGPVLYSQLRVGRHGRRFRIYKFRSMVVNADKLGSSVTTGGDRRITTIGRILRRTKLDELPQLWNVLTGDMSLVGPRPDVPEIVDTYNPELRRILEVRPGMTSIASLHLRDEELLLAVARHPDDAYLKVMVPYKIRLAMQHVENQSIWFDLKIIWQTIWALTAGRLMPPYEDPTVTDIRVQIDHLNHQNELVSI